MGKQYGNPKYGKPVTAGGSGGRGFVTFVMCIGMFVVASYAMWFICTAMRAAF